MNIFERASRKGLTFMTEKGPLSTDQLWQLPLTSRSGFDLDTTARAVHAELTAGTAISFVQTEPNAKHKELELQLEILKHIIDAKLSDKKAAETRAANASQAARIDEILAQKHDAGLMDLSEEELLKRRNELSGSAA